MQVNTMMIIISYMPKYLITKEFYMVINEGAFCGGEQKTKSIVLSYLSVWQIT